MHKLFAGKSQPMSDEKRLELVNSLKNQDQIAIAELYDLYGPVVYSIAFRIVKSTDLAATVVQDTFCKVWKYGVNYDPEKSGIFTWITSIARNTAIDATRNQHFKSASKLISLDNVSQYATNESNTHDGIGVSDLLKKMTDKHLTLLKKYYFQGYTHSEMVTELGIPLGTIKTRLRSAVQELRRTLPRDLNVYHTS